MDGPLGRFPSSLPAPVEGGSYALDPDRVAVRGGVPASLRAGIEDSLEGADWTVVRTPAEGGGDLPPERVTPVYTLGEGGLAFVPTGRATVRFAEGTDPGARSDELRAAGYAIERILPWAPHVAVVGSLREDRAEALSGIGRLADLDGVEHVELEMLSRGRRR